jgi:hypothetical protein
MLMFAPKASPDELVEAVTGLAEEKVARWRADLWRAGFQGLSGQENHPSGPPERKEVALP